MLRLGPARRERVLLRAPGLGKRRLPRLQQRVHPGERAGVQRGFVGDDAARRLEFDQPVGGEGRPRLRRARERDHRLLLLLGAVQEVEVLQQVGEAVRIEDHADEIRAVGFVARDELAGEQDPCPRELAAESFQPGSLAHQSGVGGGERRLVVGELGADGRLAGLDERDLAVQRADQRRKSAKARAQILLTRLLGPELRAELSDARGAGGRRRDGTHGSDTGQRWR